MTLTANRIDVVAAAALHLPHEAVWPAADAAAEGVTEKGWRRLPNAIAIVTAGKERVTFSQLDYLATRIAQDLLARGVRPNADLPVGVPAPANSCWF